MRTEMLEVTARCGGYTQKQEGQRGFHRKYLRDIPKAKH